MAKIQFKAILHKLGLWLVVKDGPHKCPPSGGGGLIENHNESNNNYYSLRDRVTEGPVTSNQILAIIQKANPSVVIDPHSIYIWHETVAKSALPQFLFVKTIEKVIRLCTVVKKLYDWQFLR